MIILERFITIDTLGCVYEKESSLTCMCILLLGLEHGKAHFWLRIAPLCMLSIQIVI